jgi:hypothetical protein
MNALYFGAVTVIYLCAPHGGGSSHGGGGKRRVRRRATLNGCLFHSLRTATIITYNYEVSCYSKGN